CRHRNGRQPGVFHMRPKTVGLIANTGKRGAPDLVRLIRAQFEERGVRVLFETSTAELVDESPSHECQELARKSDLLVVLGGDGTILNAIAMLGDEMKPIFGINIGSLGFLTCAASSWEREAV